MRLPNLILLLIVICSIKQAGGVIECFTVTGWVESAEGVQCAECQLRGYIDQITEECVYEDDVVPIVQTVEGMTSRCENLDYEVPFCEVDNDDYDSDLVCKQSRRGTRCVECGGRGFLIWTGTILHLACSCYSSRLDPNTGCQQTVLDSLPFYSEQTMSNLTATKITCNAYNSTVYGCYSAVDSSEHKYGTPNPPIPTACCHENIGPPPQMLTEGLLQVENQGSPLQVYAECNRIGGISPNIMALPLNLTFSNETDAALRRRSWEVCHGNGIWNDTSRACECNNGWQLASVGIHEGSELLSCVACMPLWGPDSVEQTEDPPFCSKIYTPNPVTGVNEECGGVGTFMEGRCNCFGNMTHGFWGAINITRLDVTVESCGICLSFC